MAPSRLSKFFLAFGPGLLLAGLTLAVYSNSFGGPFVLDDTSSIKNNTSIRRLWPVESPTIGGTRGRPLVNFSLALNYHTSGLEVAAYHWTNLAIHVGAGLLLFGVVRRTFQLPSLGGKFSESGEAIALSAAALWLVHPLQTESVTYVVQRTESLMGLHYLLTFYCFIRSIQSPETRRSWQMLAVVACFAGMACKEVMVTAPFALWLYDRTFVAGTFVNVWRERGRFHLALASSWLALAWLMTGLGDRGIGYAGGISPWQYALTEAGVLLQYFKLSLWPAPLVFDYGAEYANSLAEVWPSALLVVVGLIVALAALRVRPALGLLLAWPFIALAPTSSFVPVALQPMAEHRMYVPLVGLVVLIVAAAHRYLGRKAWLLIAPVACLFGVMTFQRNAVYADEILLWRDTAEKAPANARAFQNLGTAYLNAGRFSEAQVELERTLALTPGNFQAVNNLGIVHARSGRPAQALEYFEKAVRAAPGFAEAHYNIGCLLLEQGRRGEAAVCFENAVRLNPAYLEAHVNLAATLVADKNFRAAAEHYSSALRVQPDDPKLYSHRAYANIQIGRIREAIADYEQALKLQPDLPEARHNLEVLRLPPRAPAP